jgi:plastocyanin domain-containing protein
MDGVQVLNVGLAGGYYRPNRFTVQAGVPVKVVFTGYAVDCLGQPEFPELGLKGDMSNRAVTATDRAAAPVGGSATGQMVTRSSSR